ncbi:ester cyclase [Rhizobium laguerreae]|nr:ester cyclase [Rhizobium laguerreae]
MFSDEGYMRDMPTGVEFRGQAIGKSIGGFVSAFPDAHRDLLSVCVADNIVVVELAIQGTHKGDLAVTSGTLAPTGKTIDVPCCDVFHLENGKVKILPLLQSRLGNAATARRRPRLNRRRQPDEKRRCHEHRTERPDRERLLRSDRQQRSAGSAGLGSG